MKLALVLEGSFDFDTGVEKTALLSHLAECLRKVDARGVHIIEGRVSFRGGLFRGVSNWNVLAAFGSGELIVDEVLHAVRYRLSVGQIVALVTLIVAAMAASIWSDTRRVGWSTLFPALAWLWLVGGNLAVGLPRFKSFLRNAIDSLYL